MKIFKTLILVVSGIFLFVSLSQAQPSISHEGNRLLEKLGKPIDAEMQQWLDFYKAKQSGNDYYGQGIHLSIHSGVIDGISLYDYHEPYEEKVIYRYYGVMPFGLTPGIGIKPVIDGFGNPHYENVPEVPYKVYLTYNYPGYSIKIKFNFNRLYEVRIYKNNRTEEGTSLSSSQLRYQYYNRASFTDNPDDLVTKLDCYSGDCYDGYGKAWLNASKFDSYEGYWKDGTANGQAKYFHYWKLQYEGNFVSGTRSGKGKFFSFAGRVHDGFIFEGNFVNDELTGFGTAHTPHGSRITGTWNSITLANNSGTYYFNNGLWNKFEGPIVNYVPHGTGKLTYKDGTVKQVEFADGSLPVLPPVVPVDSNKKLINWGNTDFLNEPFENPFDEDKEEVITDSLILQQADFCEVFLKIAQASVQKFDPIKGEVKSSGFGQKSYTPTVKFSKAVASQNISGTQPLMYIINLARAGSLTEANDIFDQLKEKIISCIPDISKTNVTEQLMIPEGTYTSKGPETKHFILHSDASYKTGNVIRLFVEKGFIDGYQVSLRYESY